MVEFVTFSCGNSCLPFLRVFSERLKNLIHKNIQVDNNWWIPNWVQSFINQCWIIFYDESWVHVSYRKCANSWKSYDNVAADFIVQQGCNWKGWAFSLIKVLVTVSTCPFSILTQSPQVTYHWKAFLLSLQGFIAFQIFIWIWQDKVKFSQKYTLWKKKFYNPQKVETFQNTRKFLVSTFNWCLPQNREIYWLNRDQWLSEVLPRYQSSIEYSLIFT